MNQRIMTYRKDTFSLVAGTIYKLTFRNTCPNHFLINSSINDVLYISDTPNVSNQKYSKKINGISRQLYAEINGIRTLYLLTSTNGEITIESYYAEFTESSINGDINTIDNNDLSSPIAQEIALTGGVEYPLKLTPGWIVSFGSGESAFTEIRNGSGNTVWTGDYISSTPFYLDDSIYLYCATDNDYVSIVYL